MDVPTEAPAGIAQHKPLADRHAVITADAGLIGHPYTAAYCVAKHADHSMCRTLDREFATKPVTVNPVCPGYIDTDIIRDTLDNIVTKTGRCRERALAEILFHSPQRQLVKPYELANAVARLCLPSSASTSGQRIFIADGEVM